LKQTSQDPRIPSASLQVEHLFPQHPYFPIGLELDDTGLLTATSTWVAGTGSCDYHPSSSLLEVCRILLRLPDCLPQPNCLSHHLSGLSKATIISQSLFSHGLMLYQRDGPRFSLKHLHWSTLIVKPSGWPRVLVITQKQS
jgi:hypothetical protein